MKQQCVPRERVGNYKDKENFLQQLNVAIRRIRGWQLFFVAKLRKEFYILSGVTGSGTIFFTGFILFKYAKMALISSSAIFE